MTRTPKSYHQATSYDRYAMEPHPMDWAGQPNPYKSYSSVLPPDDGADMPEIQDLYDQDLQAVYESAGVDRPAAVPNLNALSRICLLAGGLTARSRQGNGYFYFRSAPSAGALYPNEMYVVAFEKGMIPPGVYHCGVHNRFFTRLRDGDFKAPVISAVPALPADAAGIFIITGIFFRSAWKYRKRAYRYVLMDGGHLAENLRLAIGAAGLTARLCHAFDDRKLDVLLGLDETREGSICCLSLSGGRLDEISSQVEMKPLPRSIQAASRVSPAEIEYPEITDIHDASKSVRDHHTEAEAAIDCLGVKVDSGCREGTLVERNPALLNYSETVFARRSKRNFIPAPLQKNQLNYILTLLCRAYGHSALEHPGASASVAMGFLAGNVSDMDSGFYLLDAAAKKIGRVFSGKLIEGMTAICLDQAWLKNAAVHALFMSNLAMLEQRWGARGYRYAMLTAGRLGHAVYLGATAQKLGSCGIGALYDNEARRLLGLNEDSALLYLVAVGRVR